MNIYTRTNMQVADVFPNFWVDDVAFLPHGTLAQFLMLSIVLSAILITMIPCYARVFNTRAYYACLLARCELANNHIYAQTYTWSNDN